MYWRITRLLRHAQALQVNIRRYIWHVKSKRYPRDVNGDFLLHIGCGEIDAPHFINIDARPYPHIHIVTRNLFDLRNIPDSTIALVYMCHVLEHVPHSRVRDVLFEVRRVLKPEGVLRLSVPDFNLLISIYHETGNQIDAVEPPLMGGQDYPENFHYTIFNADKLTKLLQSVGMVNVRMWDPQLCDHHNFFDWANRQHPYKDREFAVSLNMEANVP